MPAAGAGLIDIGALAILCAIFLLVYALFLTNAYAPSFPIIGNVWRDYIGDPLEGWLRWSGNTLANAVWGANVAFFWTTINESVYAGSNLWNAIVTFSAYVFNAVSGTISTDIRNLVNWAYNENIGFVSASALAVAQQVQNSLAFTNAVVANINADISTIKNMVTAIGDPLTLVRQPAIDAIDSVLAGVGFQTRLLLQEVGNITTYGLPTVNALAHQALSDADTALQKVTALDVAANPIIFQFPLLANVVAGIVADLPNIRNDATKAWTMVQEFAPALPIALAGDIAIENILKLGEDPCFCFNSGGDMEWVKLAVADQVILNGI